MSMTPSRRTIEAMTLGGMAMDNRTLIVRCYACRRTRVFLATDLVQVFGAERSPHGLFHACSKCSSSVWVGFGFPSQGQMICRPVALTRWSWTEAAYEITLPTTDL